MQGPGSCSTVLMSSLFCFCLLLIKQENIQPSQSPSEKRLGDKRGLPCRKRSTQRPLAPHSFSNIENKAWIRPIRVQEGKAKQQTQWKRRGPLYKRFSFDDEWMERNRKRKLAKETQSDRENESSNPPEDQFKVRTEDRSLLSLSLAASLCCTCLSSGCTFNQLCCFLCV